MAARPFPRYFVPRSNDGSGRRMSDPISSIHALDNFFVGGRHVSEREWIVTVDQAGELNLIPGEDKSVFSNDVQSELAYSEMVGSGGRVLDVSEFFLFNVQLLEQPGDAPGLNDPVYLYGTLYGPFPSGDASSQPAGMEGQLTVTRGDLLDGFLQARNYPFSISPEGEIGMRNFHIALAGDREEEIDRGIGVILAYPLLPADIIQDNPSNELVVTQMLFDVLSSLKDDMVKEKVANPLRTMTLPVPNRMMVEEQLKQRGYTIEGDTAVIKTTVTQGFQGFLASTFGSIMKDRLELPPQGSLDGFLEIAETALKAFKGWPPKRIWALHNRTAAASADVRMRAARYCPGTVTQQPRAVNVPSPSAAPPVVSGNVTSSSRTPAQLPRPHDPVRPLSADGPMATWMKDFVDSHQKPGAPAARLTTTGPPPCTPKTPASKPKAEWMNDFGDPVPKKNSDEAVTKKHSDSSKKVSGSSQKNDGPKKDSDSSKKEPKGSPAQSKPDWMKDFE